ncbi:hypothetical protein TESG_00558 [Trichophyton tonsurans CBS 112818]|uniref:Uncharacterized protein n=1 Tax=Trichophyton tonsurans (strain CBS 112818) TaxID=647933 RepID=F2RNU3_TRIT1|nr:hypothetical protein TESG_00558 [Trichophyton tonsurans CBS 112818]
MDTPKLQDWTELSELPFDYEDFNLSPTTFNNFCEEFLQTNADEFMATATTASEQYKLAELEEKVASMERSMEAVIEYMKKVEIWMKDVKEGLRMLSEPPKSPVILE